MGTNQIPLGVHSVAQNKPPTASYVGSPLKETEPS